MIINKLKDGDISALETLYDSLHKRLYLFLLKIVRDENIAQDVLHSAFVKVWEKRDKLSCEKPLEAQVYVIARNLLLNYIKRQKIEKQVIENLTYSDTVTSFDGIKEVSYNETFSLYEQAIEKLPPKRKEIYILSRLKGHTNKEIAEKLSISPNTVENQLGKANAFIRENLKHLKDSFNFVFLVL